MGFLLGLVVVDIIILSLIAANSPDCTVFTDGATSPFVLALLILCIIIIVSGAIVSVQSRYITFSEFNEQHQLGYGLSSFGPSCTS